MAQTQTANYFSGLRDQLTGVGLDILRARYIDAQTPQDEKNVPDEADFRYNVGSVTGNPLERAPGGVPLSTWAVIGLGLVAGVIVLKKFL